MQLLSSEQIDSKDNLISIRFWNIVSELHYYMYY